MDLHSWREAILPTTEQTPLSPLVLPFSDHHVKDGMAPDSVYILSAQRNFDDSWLHLVRTSSTHNWLASGLHRPGCTSGGIHRWRGFPESSVKVEGNYPATDVRTLGWVHSNKRQWWSNLTLYILEDFGGDLKRLGLYERIRATRYKIEVSVPNFYALLDIYYPSFRTFFTPVSELGLALHEMSKISNLPLGSLPYDKYVPCTAEFKQLKTQDETLFETYPS